MDIKNNNLNFLLGSDIDMPFSKFLYRSLSDMSGYTRPKEGIDSINIEYILNSHGYRCNEFKDQEILTLGCSQTEGHGMPVELTWPYLISQKMNKDYINLAKGGDGMQGQVIKAFQFFKEFYNPKYIFAALPLSRMEVPLIGIKSLYEKNNHSIARSIFSNQEISLFSKAPHLVENVLPQSVVIFYNILFIKMLIQYCKANNIKLLWTTINDHNIKIPSFKNLDSGYFEASFLNKENNICHEEISSNELFTHAADNEYWLKEIGSNGHWGMHQHIHIAEDFFGMI